MSLELILFVGFAGIVGILCGLIAFVPKIRKTAKLKTIARKRLFIVLGLLAFLVIFLGGSWVQSQFHSNVITCRTFGEAASCSKVDGVDNELWLRQMVPPPIRNICLGGSNENCRIINQYDIATADAWGGYVTLWFASLLASLLAILIAGRLTQK